jgi:hypothetical protein
MEKGTDQVAIEGPGRAAFVRARSLMAHCPLHSLLDRQHLGSVCTEDRDLLSKLVGPHTWSDVSAVLTRVVNLLHGSLASEPDYLPAILLLARASSVLYDDAGPEVIPAWERAVASLDGAVPGSAGYEQILSEILERNPPERVTTSERVETHILGAYECLGDLYQHDRRYEDAIRVYEAATRCGAPNEWALSSFWGIAECYWRMGEVDRGIQVLDDASSEFPVARGPADALRHRRSLGVVYKPRRRREGTRKSLEERDQVTLHVTALATELPEIQRLAADGQWSEVLHWLSGVAASAPTGDYIGPLLADAYWTCGRHADAVQAYQSCGNSNLAANLLLNCKAEAGIPLTGEDLLRQAAHQGFSYTRFTRANWEPVAARCQQYLDAFGASHGEEFLGYFARKYASGRAYASDSAFGRKGLIYCFYAIPEFSETVSSAARECENSVRAEMGVAPIGEGWVSETALFHFVRKLLPDFDVQHHARPEWLGQQHLDIYIPELRTAVEYQGQQHTQPVGFFGGEAALEATQQRDDEKRRKCAQHAVRLIYVTHEEEVSERTARDLVDRILAARNSSAE